MLLDETRAKARDWRLAILLIADDAVPAAERLKNVAPGVKPGVRLSGDAEPRKGRKTLRRVFRPYGAESNTNTNPELAPGATFLSRSAASRQSGEKCGMSAAACRSALNPRLASRNGGMADRVILHPEPPALARTELQYPTSRETTCVHRRR